MISLRSFNNFLSPILHPKNPATKSRASLARKHNKRNTALLSGKQVYVFFPPKERAFDHGSYFAHFVSDIASREDCIAVVVSPYMLKSTGIEKSRKPYYISRLDGQDILLVRRHYYFTLRKKIIDVHTSSLTEIY